MKVVGTTKEAHSIVGSLSSVAILGGASRIAIFISFILGIVIKTIVVIAVILGNLLVSGSYDDDIHRRP